MKKKIFITGGAGFLGAGIIEELINYDYKMHYIFCEK